MATNNFDDNTQAFTPGMNNGMATPKAEKKDGNMWAKVAVGATAGIMLGAGSAYAATVSAGDGDETDPKVDVDTVADGVKDDMSFSEAFNAARAEVGPGGVFHWHGGLYSTYTETEWDNLSDSERSEFAARAQGEVRGDEGNPDHYVAHHAEPHHVEVHEEVAVVEHHHPATETTTGGEAGDDEIEVHIVSEEEGNIEGHDVYVGAGTIGGHAAVVVDIDENGVYDQAIIDVNDNGEVDDNETYDIQDADIHVGTSGTFAVHPDGGAGSGSGSGSEYYASTETMGDGMSDDGMPDYVDDAMV